MDIESKIREFVAQNLSFNEDGFNLPDDASFLQQGVIDSLGVVELVDFASREFGVDVKPAEVIPTNFDSVAALAAFVRRKTEVPGEHYVGS
ncbi:MAG TPA: acyl carrier protein [Candidatus Dormibacteraeota bacterium]|nr:acyl carrier protein [Candidatus Dormibacteraeota bacterium]